MSDLSKIAYFDLQRALAERQRAALLDVRTAFGELQARIEAVMVTMPGPPTASTANQYLHNAFHNTLGQSQQFDALIANIDDLLAPADAAPVA
jgi:hypothetical protein